MKGMILCLLVSVLASLAGDIDFNRDIRPILSDRCVACHGPDSHDRKAKLRLDQANGPDGAYRTVDGVTAIKPGSLEDSEVWHRITTSDPDEIMPPPNAHKKAITDTERALLKQWIEEGAKYDGFWAFEPPAAPANATIDSLVERQLKAEGLAFSAAADKRTLIRRLTFDLTGLPPTRDEVRAFVADDSPMATERLVDLLLARPQFGEHMARYWLDLVRFADTNGMHKDFYRNLIAYRDWVIRSFNDNLSYDEFVRYQLAGDLFPDASDDQLVASGFNRLHLIIDKGTALPEESFAKNVYDRVAAVGTVFMGLTVNCAQCHDHKYDPITQKDYYSLFAFFNNIDATPETVRAPKNGLQAPFISLKNGGQAMVMRERKDVRKAFLLKRGQYDDPGDEVFRDTPEFLPPLKKKDDVATRLDLANWMVARDNPLTARVAVNRFWQQFFGVGLVKTSEDLGAQGEVPSHPELLDLLAVNFVENGWDIKDLVRDMVLSRTYQQTSVSKDETFRSDPENRKLARGSRYRMDAEMIRDQILSVSGLLSETMYGPSVKPPQPAGLWASVTMIGERYKADTGEPARRRSLYTYWKRGMPPPQMTILNAPIRDACTARRERTNTPSQALLLLNEQAYMEAARTLAQRILKEEKGDRLAFAHETVTGHVPDPKEAAVLGELLDAMKTHYSAQPDLAAELCEGTDAKGEVAAELAAWTLIVNTLFNLDTTKTRE